MLVGDPEALQRELAAYDVSRLPIGVIPSEGVIEEGEPPALALRQKPKASILVATGVVKRGMADACVTMGSTGAAMAAAAVVLGLVKGVERPALGGPVVGVAPKTCIVDLGTKRRLPSQAAPQLRRARRRVRPVVLGRGESPGGAAERRS